MKNYYDFLKEELNNFQGDFDKFILNIPDFFQLLCDLLEEENINREDRQKINSALAYFVTPNDILPEEIFGPIGYVDDVFVCVTVLNEMREKYGLPKLEKLWGGDEDLNSVLKASYKRSYEILTEKELVDPILKFAGLE
ncbi:DUF1232 domain-containing protein [Candidatus Amoebophilus asiaticus]|nr:DUF1232 domain-containing protein [Candidatus Amoebophilus asiaticus]